MKTILEETTQLFFLGSLQKAAPECRVQTHKVRHLLVSWYSCVLEVVSFPIAAGLLLLP